MDSGAAAASLNNDPPSASKIGEQAPYLGM